MDNTRQLKRYGNQPLLSKIYDKVKRKKGFVLIPAQNDLTGLDTSSEEM